MSKGEARAVGAPLVVQFTTFRFVSATLRSITVPATKYDPFEGVLRVITGVVESTVKLKLANRRFPARSVAFTRTVYAPSVQPVVAMSKGDASAVGAPPLVQFTTFRFVSATARSMSVP